MSVSFYRWFSERRLTSVGRARRARVEGARLALVMRQARPPGEFLEIGPGHGSLADLAVKAGWRYRAVEASPLLADALRARGLEVIQAWAPPIPLPDASCHVVYADQVLEHMSTVDAARELTAEVHRVLRPGGVFFAVVPDYVKEGRFFFDIDYTHNFVTTERRMRQLLGDAGFDVAGMVRSIGGATGPLRDAMALAALVANLPGLDALSRYTRTHELLFRVRKNLFQTLAFAARKPIA
jgi:SAM-dependent methyltransferase